MVPVSSKQINKGMGLVEVIIGTTLISLGLLGMISAYNYYLHVAVTNTPHVQAAYLLEESLEAMRILRDQSWSGNIETLGTATSSPYFLNFSTSTNSWNTTTTNTLVNGIFERKVTAAAVYRNGSTHDIASSGNIDTDTRLITATVSWRDGSATTSKSMSTYLTNMFAN